LKRRVVITGMGIVSPLGNDLNSFWDNLTGGRSGISHITCMDTAGHEVKIAGEVKNLDLDRFIPPKEQKRMDRFVHLGLAAACLAMEDSGFEADEELSPRFGVFASSATGGLITFEETARKLVEKGPGRISPLFVPKALVNLLAGNISIRVNAKGPNMSTVSACASGAHGIGNAFWLIQTGRADYMLAGAAEADICDLGIGGFAAMKALSTRNDAPEKASRPWDRDRDGFVVSEGGAMAFLETLESAVRRGANIYAEIVGFGMSGDAHHVAQPDGDGLGAQLCMKEAARDAGVSLDDIDYINAHGTSTPLGDRAEAQAIKIVFGDKAARLAISSSKSMTGHLLGAAGSLEALICALTLKYQTITPTINLDNVEPECAGLNYTPHTAVNRPVIYAMNNSFGFGGANCSIVLKKV